MIAPPAPHLRRCHPRLAHAWPLLAALALAAVASGCMTEPPDNDLPWNKPQSWEGTPALPSGMFQNQ